MPERSEVRLRPDDRRHGEGDRGEQLVLRVAAGDGEVAAADELPGDLDLLIRNHDLDTLTFDLAADGAQLAVHHVEGPDKGADRAPRGPHGADQV